MNLLRSNVDVTNENPCVLIWSLTYVSIFLRFMGMVKGKVGTCSRLKRQLGIGHKSLRFLFSSYLTSPFLGFS